MHTNHSGVPRGLLELLLRCQYSGRCQRHTCPLGGPMEYCNGYVVLVTEATRLFQKEDVAINIENNDNYAALTTQNPRTNISTYFHQHLLLAH